MDKRPPGRSINSGESIHPWLIAATAAAQAPVPQAWVSPADIPFQAAEQATSYALDVDGKHVDIAAVPIRTP